MAAALRGATAAIASPSEICVGCERRAKRSLFRLGKPISFCHSAGSGNASSSSSSPLILVRLSSSSSSSPSSSCQSSSSTARNVGCRASVGDVEVFSILPNNRMEEGLSRLRGTTRHDELMSTTTAAMATRGDKWMDDEMQMSAPTSFPRSLDTLDVNNVMMRQRIVFLGSQVDDMSADWIVSQLLLLDAQDPTKDIKLFINSPGGSITAGMAIYDAMKLCRADVSTICFGLAASMGAFLLCAGTKGKRYAMPNSRIMIHQPLGGAQGAAIDVALQVREMIYHKLKLNRIMSYLTGKTEAQIEKDTDRDYFMSAWEAKEYGLVDHVVDDGKPGLVAPIGEVKERKGSEWEYYKVREGKARKDLPSEIKLMPTKR